MWYIIGIGANIGDVIPNINNAINLLKTDFIIENIGNLYSSNALLKDDSPDEWNIKYLNTAIKIETILQPIEVLSFLKKIEQKIGRNLNAQEWSPRVIDLDILAYENDIFDTDNLNIPHKELLNRSFALAPLLDIKYDWKHPSNLNLDLHKHILSLDKIEKLNQRIYQTMRMGICNLSNQSFSDGHYTDNQRLQNLYQLIDDGAEIIDIGAESTKPNAKPILVDEEFSKLDTFLTLIKNNIHKLKYRPLISIDTRKLEVTQKILEKHDDIIWMINDVECNEIEKKAKLISKYNKKYVITHNMGIENRSDYLSKENVINKVCDFLIEKKQILINNRVNKSNIYFDVGFGFGKTADVAKILLDNISYITTKVELKSLIGHSRKASILGLNKESSIDQLDVETQKLTKYLEKMNINIVRVHKI